MEVLRSNNSTCIEIAQFVEFDVKVTVKTGSEKKSKQNVNNNKLKVIRECILRLLNSTLSSKPIFCVDLQNEDGIAGLQWKKHFSSKLNVLIAQNKAVDAIKRNCQASDFLWSEFNFSFERQPGDVELKQKDDEVHICQCQPNVLLHLEAFDFIFLQPEGHVTNYFDSVFSNLRNDGLLCLTSSDISIQFTRTANVIRRYCHAHVMKVDYMREMAVRVIIACAVRSASRCNKGLDVLLTACIEDTFLIVLRVCRGPQNADKSLDQIKEQLHCQICEERCFLPGGLTPVENPYSLLPCSCHEEVPGRTAVVLGPMWSGKIFDSTFISNLLKPSDELPVLSEQLKKVLLTIQEEAICSYSDFSDTLLCDTDEPVSKKPKIGVSKDTSIVHPPFYINLHKRRFKDVVIPKMRKLLSFLRSEGYRASRTHFDPKSVRTNANLTQFHNVLLKHCKKNKQ
ncbi:TRMT1-like protein [Saccostrea echinata]|uniref:TRMT1-like protein n=1 Tax=Saccostrea echinata TaxID=191078 RepID=UPI002A7EE5A6|nr:TRMT1-like protein [Saccostrea echinata]